MTFLEVVSKVRSILNLIDTYDDAVRETLRSIKWIFTLCKLEAVNSLIDFICDNEIILIKYILDIIELAEETPEIKGIEKLNKALQFTHQQFREASYPSLIQQSVSLINFFVKKV